MGEAQTARDAAAWKYASEPVNPRSLVCGRLTRHTAGCVADASCVMRGADKAGGVRGRCHGMLIPIVLHSQHGRRRQKGEGSGGGLRR